MQRYSKYRPLPFFTFTMTKADDTFLRRDGGNKAKSDIDLDSHKLINVADPTHSKDAANKDYVDTNSAGTNKVSKSGDVMSGDLLFTADKPGDNDLLVGCTNLPRGKRFAIALGNRRNRLLEFRNLAGGGDQNTLTWNTTHGVLFRSRDTDVCQMGNEGLSLIHI